MSTIIVLQILAILKIWKNDISPLSTDRLSNTFFSEFLHLQIRS